MTREEFNEFIDKLTEEFKGDSSIKWKIPSFKNRYKQFNSLKSPKARIRRLLKCNPYAFTKYTCFLKNGKEKGLEKWNNYCNFQAEKNTKSYKMKHKGMTSEEIDEYNKSRAVTKENLIKKHGEEEGLKIWKRYCDRQKYTTSLEYFIEKYGKEKGEEKYYRQNFLKGHNLDSYKVRYGENAEEKLQQYWDKRNSPHFYSKKSQILFDKIRERFSNLKMYYATLNKEFGILKNGKYYFYDFVIPDLKYCIEFNGDHWHGNPDLYKEDDIPKACSKLESAGEIWKKDKLKSQAILDRGFILKVIWESDFDRNPEQILKEVSDEINDLLRKSKL